MPENCLNPYECEWSIALLWRWMNWFGRVDVLILVLMLAYVLAVSIWAYYGLVHCARDIHSCNRRKLKDDLIFKVGLLKSIASAAPYLGLLGAVNWIADGAFVSFDMEKHAAEVMQTSRISVALLSTAAGILVAVPAIGLYNYFCTRIELLQKDLLIDSARKPRPQAVLKFRLPKRFSQLPAFAMIAAPVLAVLVACWTPFFSPREPTGLDVEIARVDCVSDADRMIVLHLTDTGKLFLNAEQQDLANLSVRLSQIYSSRGQSTLYLQPDDGVAFQTIADSIDAVQNTTGVGGKSLDIRVRLVTPETGSAPCRQPLRSHQPKPR